MEEGSEQPRGDAFIYALRDEAAYLETGEDEKPAVVAEPLPDRASFNCSFCRSTDRRVSSVRSTRSGTPKHLR